jgi:hypothetical protein
MDGLQWRHRVKALANVQFCTKEFSMGLQSLEDVVMQELMSFTSITMFESSQKERRQPRIKPRL